MQTLWCRRASYPRAEAAGCRRGRDPSNESRPMRTHRLHYHALAALVLATPLTAQSEDWLTNCRRSHGGDDNRVVHCEERESRLPARGTLRVDGRQNGGVTVRAWDGDGILVRARIQTTAESDADAREIARGITVSTG